MKKALLSLVIAALAGTLCAAQLVEAIVIRVGDRVVTRTQYLKRLHDGYNEIEQTAQAADAAAKKEEFRKSQQIAEQARNNADFALIAKTTSQAPTKDKGGDLGEVAKGELLPELDKAVFNSQAGAVIGPIEAKTAWHILKVEQRLPSEVPAFES